MYPLTLVRISKNKHITLELKNNSKLRGFLKKCDLLMNLHLLNVTITDEEDKNPVFYEECFLRGTSIKTLNIDPKLLNKKEPNKKN